MAARWPSSGSTPATITARRTRFLRSAPVSYPSYFDPGGSIGFALSDSSFTPVTVFHGAHGGLFIHQGPYRRDAELERDVVRYGLDA